ncbi:hypothetical protein [Rhizobacter sp. Root404]|uniref:hypothetical protein n=1 Tax=Rhizobacter sp. Root404 TaxID=1736528 RepID=UPI0006F35369|nr:hypothetical protein [Rhizobacter sp. Root404]KQW35540.1 hypothetical protein ASC76_21270 [Rhizobacter sp. Root404]
MNTAVTSLPMTSAAAAAASTGAGLRRQFKQAGAVIWRALEAAGRARAQRHLLAFAAQCEALQPELAKELRAASRQGPLA